MHFSIESLVRPKRLSKALKKALAEAGHPLALSTCQNAIAQIYGRTDWHHLTKTVDGVAQRDTAAEQRDLRDRHEQTVLVAHGVPLAVVRSVLTKISPSARDADYSGLPALLLHIESTFGDRRKTVLIDVTEAALERLAWNCEDPEETVFGSGPHEHHRLLRLLPVGAMDTLFEGERRGTLTAPRQAEDWKIFAQKVGDLSDPDVVVSFMKQLRDLRWKKRRLEGARKTLETALSAVSVSAADTDTRFVMAVDDWGGDRIYDPTDKEIYSWSLNQEYAETIEARPSSQGAEADEAWRSRFRLWEKAIVPPFAFATSPSHWCGLDPEWVREEAMNADEGERIDPVEFKRRIRDMIETDLTDNHHEDAREEISDLSDLDFLVEWVAEAGTGSAADRSLEERIAAWNAKQSIVSYYRNDGVIVLLRQGDTKEDAIAWCRRNIERERDAVARLRLWSIPPRRDQCSTGRRRRAFEPA